MPAPQTENAGPLAAGCAILPPDEDGKLLLEGADAAEVLDGQLSNDIAGLDPGSGCWAALLTPKGRMLAPVRALRTDAGVLLLTERPTLQALFDRLRVGLLGWEAELHKETLELGRIELAGPQTGDVLAAASLPIPGPGELEHAAQDEIRVVRTKLGADVLAPAGHEQPLRDALVTAGAEPATRAALEVAFVERGIPRWGAELDESTMPEEAGLVDDFVSFTKGCYVGQETVARLHWKGKPNRHLRVLSAAEPLERGAAVTVASDDDGEPRALGQVSSSAVSPVHGPLALAMLRREAGPGDGVDVAGVRAKILAAPPVPA